MKYHLHYDSQDRGVFELDELRRLRQANQLIGAELVWTQGMPDWQPLDTVLRSVGVPVPPVHTTPRLRKTKGPLLWVSLGLAVGVVFAVGTLIALSLARRAQVAREQEGSRPDPIQLAGKPITWRTNTMTATDVRARAKAFRWREWVEEFRDHNTADEACRADGLKFLQAWVEQNYGSGNSTNTLSLREWADKLAGQTNCQDPLVLTAIAVNSSSREEWVQHLENALEGFRTSKYRGYPKFYAGVILASQLEGNRGRVEALDSSNLQWFSDACKDGSITPADQPEVADLLILGWGKGFFHRYHAALYGIPRTASMPWLAHMLEGEHYLIEAWKARGGGYADSVSDKGWEGFATHLAQARQSFTAAWQLKPDLVLAASRMEHVALGDRGLEDMRTWFDRATAAQIDQEDAWSNLRWGLRPRWYGNQEAILALGRAALRTRRFDTDVPRKFLDCVGDVEGELKLAPGEHIYEQSDIWPNIEQLYEGYIAEPSARASRNGWRSAYSVVAYLAKKYKVARAQLEALQWKPASENLLGWEKDLSLMPLEVAARTSPVDGTIALAESQRERGLAAGAFAAYRDLQLPPGADEQTRRFVEHRLASLALEADLKQGHEIDFLPTHDPDLNWRSLLGEYRRQPDGAVEVTTTKGGHLFVSRVRVGPEFEAKSEFEVMHAAAPTFGLGLVMGLPEPGNDNWYNFAIKRNAHHEDFATFSRAWTTDQLSQPVRLQDGPNSFRVRFQSGRITAWVNGNEVFHQSRPSRGLAWGHGEFLLGLGAFNDSNGNVIQYRNLRVQRVGVGSPRRAAAGHAD
jgi:hypothetical protein